MSALTDTQAVDWIARMLRTPEWNSAADYLEQIASLLVEAGRDLDHPRDCDGCGAWPGGGCSARSTHDVEVRCVRCGLDDRLHLTDIGGWSVPLCDGCSEAQTSDLAQCEDRCSLPLDHGGVFR